MSNDLRCCPQVLAILLSLLPHLVGGCARSGYNDSAYDGGAVTDASGRDGALSITGQASIAGGGCSPAYTISRRGHDGSLSVGVDSTNVLLSQNGWGTFYSDASCVVVIESVLIDISASSVDVYLNAPIAEDLTLTAEDKAGRFAPASLSVAVTETRLVVEPAYPAHGGAWNSYVKDDGADALSARDALCGAATVGGCLHGGELKRVDLADIGDCQTLEYGDELDAFDWICRPTPEGSGLVFYSTGLSSKKGLADLVSATAWRPNRFEVRRGGEPVAGSEAALWWDNPVVPLPDNKSANRLVIDEVDDDGTGPDQSFTPGTIFTVAADQETNGYNLALDRIALVTLGSATLSYAGSSALNCHDIYANANWADDKVCLLAASSQKYLWIEGAFDGAKPLLKTADYLFNLFGVTFSTLRHVRGKNVLRYGLVLREAARNRLKNITIENTGSRGMILSSANDNTLDGVRLLQARDMGMSISGSDRNVLRDVFIAGAVEQSLYFESGTDNSFHGLVSIGCQHDLTSLTIYADGNRFVNVASHRNRGHGLLVGGDRNSVVNATLTNNRRDGLAVSCSWHAPVDNTFVGVVAANNGGSGISVGWGAHRNTISHVTALNNAVHGISMGDARSNLLHQAIAANNGDAGLSIAYNEPRENVVHHLASVHNASANVMLRYAVSSKFHGHLIVGGAPVDCDVSGGYLPGLIHGSCSLAGTTGSRDYGEQLSDAVLEVGADLSGAFIAKVMGDDPVNSSDVNGAQVAASIDDWSSFASPFRFWGLDGAAFPSSDNRGACLAGTCRIWDVRLSGNPSPVFGRHGTFVADADCPPAASGDSVVTDMGSEPNIFLTHATEVLFDGVGDDDGLCESHEACVYSPHLGAFQGDGGLTNDSCTFSRGQVVGVDLKAFATAVY